MNFLITGIVFCESANSAEVYATMEAFFKTHNIQAANLINLNETSQHRVMFDLALINNPDLMGDLKDAIANIYPRYQNGKPREHISVALVTSNAARIPGMLENWKSGHATRRPHPSEHVKYLPD